MKREPFRAFKRHYHKVRTSFAKLAETGSFKLSIEFRDGIAEAKNSVPNSKGSVNFAVLMRRFLNPKDAIFWDTIWQMLKLEFNDVINEKEMESVEASIQVMKNGNFSMIINENATTAEEIYHLISDAHYFNSDEKACVKLNQITKDSLASPFFWNQFWAYTLGGYNLVLNLFDMIKKVELSEQYKEINDNKVPQNDLCIFCLTEDGPFSSEEHVISESLGNDKMVLPKGCVCDRCNNEILSSLDQFLLDFEPIAFLRVIHVSYTKSGKLPKAEFQNISMRKTAPTHIKIGLKDKTGKPKNIKHLEDGMISYQTEIRGKKFDAVKLGRALYKIALEIITYDRGCEAVIDSRYNLARNFILGRKNFPNYLLMSTQSYPHNKIRITYNIWPRGAPFCIDIFGIIFIFNLGLVPEVKMINEIDGIKFKRFYLGDPTTRITW